MIAIKQELLALRTSDGIINARDVVQWARANERSELHSQLTWDDKIAAEEHRVWQVRQLIAIHVVDDKGHRETVHLSIDKEGGYRGMSDVLSRADLRSTLLDDALAELQRVQSKYQYVSELAEVWVATHAVASRSKRKKAA